MSVVFGQFVGSDPTLKPDDEGFIYTEYECANQAEAEAMVCELNQQYAGYPVRIWIN